MKITACLLSLWVLFAFHSFAELNAERLRVDGLAEPMSLNDGNPVLSWSLSAGPEERNVTQSAFQVQAATSPEKLSAGKADLWDSNKVVSSQPGHASYGGQKLTSAQRIYWRVRLWEGPGAPGPWSTPDWFETGLLNQADWSGPWIMLKPEVRGQAAAYLRGTISLNRPFVRARAYFSGLGWSELYVNGQRIGDRALDPAQTDYNKRCLYAADDITASAQKSGDFHHITVGAILGDGWFNQTRVWGGMSYGQPQLRAEFVFTHPDGSQTWIAAGPDWQGRSGPIVDDNVYAGEDYDARKELGDWCTAGASNDGWTSVVLAPPLTTAMAPETLPPVRCVREITTKSFQQVSPGVWIYDFGENVSGWERLKITAEAGTKIRLRFAERLKPGGTLDTITGAPQVLGCEQVDTYTAKGDPAGETWHPRFTCHGFRYAELTVPNGHLTQPPANDTLTLMVLHTDFEMTGSFVCSDEHLNQIHDMAVRTMLANDEGVPSDCPVRERCGWTGDAQTVVKYEMDNADAATFFHKYAQDIQTGATDGHPEDVTGVAGFTNGLKHLNHPPVGVPHMIAPGKRLCGIASPDWACAIVIVPWQVYTANGDVAELEQFRDSMETWADWQLSLRDDRGMLVTGLGDWCAPSMPTGDLKQWIATKEVPITSTGFFIRSLRLLAQVEDLAQRKDQATRYRQAADEMAAKWTDIFFQDQDLPARSETALAFGVEYATDPARRAKIFAALLEKTNHGQNFDTGIFGTPLMLKALSEGGRSDVARELLTKPQMPSYRAEHDAGATTLWESWPDASGHTDGSLSHPMQGGFDAWLYEDVAGLAGRIAGDAPWRFRWNDDSGLSFARAEEKSSWGPVRSAWEKKNDTVSWKISVPPGCRAEVAFPGQDVRNLADLAESGKPLAGQPWLLGSSRRTDALLPWQIIEIGSGDYNFTFNEKP